MKIAMLHIQYRKINHDSNNCPYHNKDKGKESKGNNSIHTVVAPGLIGATALVQNL